MIKEKEPKEHEGILRQFNPSYLYFGKFPSVFPVLKIVKQGHTFWVSHFHHCLLKMCVLKLIFMTSYIIF